MSNIDCSGHLGFPIGTILAIFDLEVILLLQCKSQLNSPNGLGVEVKKNGFQDGGYGVNLGFLLGIILAIFHLKVNLLLHPKFQLNLE